MEACSKMTKPSRRQFEEEFSKIESERTVQLMEAELIYHRKMSMVFESTLLSEQENLSKIQRRQQRQSKLRNNIRDAYQNSSGDDLK